MSVSSQVRLNQQRHSGAFVTVGARSGPGLDLDPFLNLDLFEMSEPTFPPHPHAGFSAVTYLLPESEGSFQNRDSLGDRSSIGPGEVHWTQAGSGMLHEEIPTVRGTVCKGFQIFVNLSEAQKQIPPRAFHSSRSSLPVVTTDAGKIVVVAGKYRGETSPIGPLATAVNLYDGTGLEGRELSLALDPRCHWFLFGVSGTGACADGTILTDRQITLFPRGIQGLSLVAKTPEFRFLLCGGEPIGEPVVWGGPFAMTNLEDVRKAQLRFIRGEMGQLSRSF